MPDLVGLSTVTANTPLTVTKTNEPSVGEVLQRWRVDDDTASFTQIMNASTTNAVFAPWLFSQNASTSFPGLFISALIGIAADSGAVPAMVIDNKKVNFTAIATRPLFDLRNSGVSALKVNADYTVLIKSLLKFDTTGLTAERNFTFPDSSGAVVSEGATQTLTNKTLTTPTIDAISLSGSTFTLDSLLQFNTTGLSAVRNITWQNISGQPVMMGTNNAVDMAPAVNGVYVRSGLFIMQNPTVTASYIFTASAIAANRAITLPLLTAADTFAMEAHAQTLTNKTIAGTSNTLTQTSNNIFVKGTTPNRLYPAGIIPGSPTALITSTTGPTVNTLYAMPFLVPTATTFDQISIEVTTAGAGSICRLGIYADNDGYPGALIFDSGNVGTTTTGLRTATITAGVQAFKPDLYWLAYDQSATVPQIRCLPGTDGLSIIGYSSPPSTTLPGLCYTVAHTVGALPNPYTAGATIRTTVSTVGSPIPAIMLRAI